MTTLTNPTTLDLTDRARLAINGLTGAFDEENRYELYPFARFSTDKPWMAHYKNHIDLTPKLIESLAYMRYMTGNTDASEVDRGVLEYALEDLGEDGLYYGLALDSRPWHEGGTYHAKEALGEDYSSLIGNARLLIGFLAWAQVDDEDGKFMAAARKLAKGLCAIAIKKRDIAYYPDGVAGMAFCYARDTGWGEEQEPDSDYWGGEGSVMCYYGQALRALSRWYPFEAEGEFKKEMRDVMDRLARFCMLTKMWGTESEEHEPERVREALSKDAGEQYVPGANIGHLVPNDPHHMVTDAEHGHFKGHFHGKLMGLRGLLEYAVATGDRKAGHFAHEGFEFARHRGIPHIGNFGDHCWLGVMEGCTAADMTALAAKLTDLGYGDYLDDVERIVRNQLMEQQFTSVESLERVRDAGKDNIDPWRGFLESMEAIADDPVMNEQFMRTEGVIERLVGTYATFSGANRIPNPYITMCCTGNCTQAIYYGWETILKIKEEQGQTHAHVNLWLDRRSAELDVVGYLPHEGKVQITNRSANRLSIRIPGWATPASCVTTVNGNEVHPTLIGRFLHLHEVQPGDVIVVEHPLENHTFHAKMPFDQEYDVTMRGHAVVKVEPENTNPHHIPVYQRGEDGSPPKLTNQQPYTPQSTPPRW